MKPLKIGFLGLMVPIALFANTSYTVTVDVIEDGEDYLLLNGNTQEWEHLSLFANGGVAGGTQTETDYAGNSRSVTNPFVHVSGTDSSNSGLNFTNSDWYNGIQGFDCTTLTCPYTDANNAHGTWEFALNAPYTITGIIGNVTLTTLICGGVASPTCGASGDSPPSILNQPATNAGTLVVDLNDIPDGGTHEFEIQLGWTDTSSTPEPASAALIGAGLIALGIVRRRQARNVNHLTT
jgi:PEP-CTERM motif-containing protein